MNESEYKDLRSIAVRRALTGAEQARLEAWLAAHPEDHADWLIEQRLDRALRRLPHIPVSTNFTSQVLRRVERLATPHPQSTGRPAWLQWLRRLGYGWRLTGAVGALALVVAVQCQQVRRRADFARSLEAMPTVGLAEVDLWRDFESINTLPTGPVPSVEELAEAFR